MAEDARDWRPIPLKEATGKDHFGLWVDDGEASQRVIEVCRVLRVRVCVIHENQGRSRPRTPHPYLLTPRERIAVGEDEIVARLHLHAATYQFDP